MRNHHLLRLLLLVILTFSCDGSDPSNVRARSIWLKHQKVVEIAAKGETVDLRSFIEAARFFDRFGITIPGDHAFMIDWYPTKETAKAVAPLRRWYQANGSRLYWDDKSSMVLLRPQPGAVQGE
jgi:hypothetical protein